MKVVAFALLLAALPMAAAAAQTPAPGDDPISRHLVPPERVMRHSQTIGLTPEQREASACSRERREEPCSSCGLR